MVFLNMKKIRSIILILKKLIIISMEFMIILNFKVWIYKATDQLSYCVREILSQEKKL